jgi:hypothetical protein
LEAVDPPPQWKDLPPGDKQAWLLDLALDRKREILALPLPDESDDSPEATRLRSLILAAADSTINQTIALRSAACEAIAAAATRSDNFRIGVFFHHPQTARCPFA